MIFIVVRFRIRPELADQWLSRVDAFTTATRAEEGNLFFDWSRSVDDPNQFVLVEGFASAEAGAVHVGSDHFKAAVEWMPDFMADPPEIVNVEVPQDGWGRMAEITPRR